jgi:flagellar basal-body rod modification protein FlgD
MVSDVSLSGAVADIQRTDGQAIGLAQDFDEFLQLLTTQLQNQDPLDPMDSTEFTNQIVQFSQVEQSINMNQKMGDLVTMQLANMASTALSYVGLDISYQSPEMNFDGQNPVKISYSLDKDAAISKVNIMNEKGTLIFSGDVPSAAGAHKFEWDGRDMAGELVPAGTYSVFIDAFDGSNDQIKAQTVVSGRVRGIETQDGRIFALVGERAVNIDTVLDATLPEENQIAPQLTQDHNQQGGLL